MWIQCIASVVFIISMFSIRLPSTTYLYPKLLTNWIKVICYQLYLLRTGTFMWDASGFFEWAAIWLDLGGVDWRWEREVQTVKEVLGILEESVGKEFWI